MDTREALDWFRTSRDAQNAYHSAQKDKEIAALANMTAEERKAKELSQQKADVRAEKLATLKSNLDNESPEAKARAALYGAQAEKYGAETANAVFQNTVNNQLKDDVLSQYKKKFGLGAGGEVATPGMLNDTTVTPGTPSIPASSTQYLDRPSLPGQPPPGIYSNNPARVEPPATSGLPAIPEYLGQSRNAVSSTSQPTHYTVPPQLQPGIVNPPVAAPIPAQSASTPAPGMPPNYDIKGYLKDGKMFFTNQPVVDPKLQQVDRSKYRKSANLATPIQQQQQQDYQYPVPVDPYNQTQQDGISRSYYR